MEEGKEETSAGQGAVFPLLLPFELQVAIWELLDRTSLCTAALVCRSWHHLSSDNHLWREMCLREIVGVVWTPRALRRRHKSWKRHFGVRLRSLASPLREGLQCVVPQLLADAQTRSAPITETVEFHITLINYSPLRGLNVRLILPHAIRGATSARRPKIGLLASSEMLRNQAEKLGLNYFDKEALMGLNKNWHAIKKWVQRHTIFLAHSSISRYLPRLLGSRLYNWDDTFPHYINDEVPLEEEVDHVSRALQVRIRRVANLHYAVGNVGMSAEQLMQNVEALAAGIAEKLPQSWGNIKHIELHATKGRGLVVYSASTRRLKALALRAAAEREQQEAARKREEDREEEEEEEEEEESN